MIGKSDKKLHHDCPIAKASQLIGDLWVILIVKELLAGPKRFGELEKAINGTEPTGNISTRTLTERLKKLEEEAIVIKHAFKEIPPRTEYTLTDKGLALSKIITDIRDYGERFLS